MTGNDSPAPSEALPASAAAPANTVPAPTTAGGMPLATGGALGPAEAAAPTTPSAPAPASAAKAAAGGELELRFAADTWYEIRDRNGKVVLGGTAHAGDVVAGGGTPVQGGDRQRQGRRIDSTQWRASGFQER